MTTPEQFLTDAGDLCALIVALCVFFAAAAWWLEIRSARRRRERETLPPPIDGRDHNAESIAEWQRKRARIDRSEVETGRPT